VEARLHRGQKRLTLAVSLRRQGEGAADDQPLAGIEIGRANLRQIPLVEQGHRQRRILRTQVLRAVAPARYPVEPGRLHLLADPGSGEHAPIAHRRDPTLRGHSIN